MGTNEFSYGTNEQGSLDAIDLKSDDGTYAYSVTPTTVYEAYTIMLHKMRTRYPETANDVDGLQPGY